MVICVCVQPGFSGFLGEDLVARLMFEICIVTFCICV